MNKRTITPLWSSRPFVSLQFTAKTFYKQSQKSLVYALLPLGVIPSLSNTQTPQLLAALQQPQAQVLPITGAQPPVKDQATITEGKVPIIFQLQFTGGLLTTQFSAWHPGIDLAIGQGTPMHAVAKGMVTEATYNYYGYGNTIVIDHGNGAQSRYAHLSKMNVKVGDTVTEDTIIGFVGTTARSTGPHLHLEVISDDQNIDPLTVLPQDKPSTDLAST